MTFLKRLCCLSLIFILALSFSYNSSLVAKSAYGELTNDKIKAKEAELAEAEKEKKSLQNNLTNVKNAKSELEKAKADEAAYVAQLDATLDEVRNKINDLSEKIRNKENEIAETELELEEALATQRAQYEAMKKRIKFLYEKGDALKVSFIFGDGNFAESLNKAEYIEKMSAYDRRMLDEYVAYSEYVSLCKKTLEEEKVVLDDTKEAQEKEKKNLEELVEEGEAQIASLNSDINSKEAAMAEYEAEIREQNDVIKVLEAAIAEERKRLAEEQQRRYDGGKFCNPCPAVKRISSEYGYRIHPILKKQQFHNGIDMAADTGTPILAAYTGTVTAAGYSDTMGNYIMINHGDGIYTIYMHASALYVSKGAEVSRGQKIAAVGSTGRSTGPHLHFSVRINGEYTSPWNYISR